MAGGMKKSKLMQPLFSGIFLISATGLALAEEAQSVSSVDPMRPPAALYDPSPTSTSASASSGLQTVIIRTGGKSLAIINGETVALGDKVGAARLVSINETQVELQGAEGKSVMRLTPAVDIKPRIQQKAKSKAAHASKRGGGKANGAPSKSKSNHKH